MNLISASTISDFAVEHLAPSHTHLEGNKKPKFLAVEKPIAGGKGLKSPCAGEYLQLPHEHLFSWITPEDVVTTLEEIAL